MQYSFQFFILILMYFHLFYFNCRRLKYLFFLPLAKLSVLIEIHFIIYSALHLLFCVNLYLLFFHIFH